MKQGKQTTGQQGTVKAGPQGTQIQMTTNPAGKQATGQQGKQTTGQQGTVKAGQQGTQIQMTTNPAGKQATGQQGKTQRITNSAGQQ